MNGLVYFVQRESGPIKIGFTAREIGIRARAIECTCGEKVKVLLTLPGDQALERKTHRYFEHLRLLGEWFQPGDDLLRFINYPRFESPKVSIGKSIQPRILNSRSPTIFALRLKDEPDKARAELETAIVAQRGNVAATARDLGVSVETVWRWIRVLGLGETVTRARQAS